MTYREALSWLGSSRRLGMKLGLEKMEALARALGSPQDRLRFVHIAGTNGKGSTAAFCAAALGRPGRGFRVGLFTSPHLRSVRERIQIDGMPISRDEFAAALGAVRAAGEALPPDLGAPTFFEILTAAALRYFTEKEVDWVVWETGLGGRLDSTNIVAPAVTIVTNVGGDHQEFLGPDTASVAAEKAGIFKRGVPAVTAADDPAALAVIRRAAEERGAPLIEIDRAFPPRATGVAGGFQQVRIGEAAYRLGLLGAHQARNAACAAAALSLLDLPPFSPTELGAAFAATRWPGRFQLLHAEPPLVVDGGHNPDGIAAALAAWRAQFGTVPYHLIYGTLEDKDAATAARLLAPGAARVSLVRPGSERAADPASLAPLFAAVPTHVGGALAGIWPSLIDHPEPVLIIGSLVLAGEALRLHNPSPDDEEEGRMNELLSPIPAPLPEP